MRRRIHVCHMRRRIHVCSYLLLPSLPSQPHPEYHLGGVTRQGVVLSDLELLLDYA
jgi:hypothetical protein